MSLFRYNGNKNPLIKYYRTPPEGTKRIVEVFAGSMAYGFSFGYPILGIELNPKLVELYRWLKIADFNALLKKFEVYSDKFDIRLANEFTEPEKTYIRLSSGSLMTGNLDKNIIYVKEKPLKPCIEKTLKGLKNHSFDVKQGNCFWEYTLSDIQAGDLIFVDPPYEGSTEDYGVKNSQIYLLTEYIKYLSSSGTPIIFTYGEGAPEIFPDFSWELVKECVVTKTRKNSQQRRRKEWVSYFNFKDNTK